jgi:trans-4-hydroxy-L-proline dehydratase
MNAKEFENYWPWMKFEDGIAPEERPEFVRRWMGMSEYYAAGFFEEQDAPLLRRYALGLLRMAEHMPLMEWQGTWLFPASPQKPPRDFGPYEQYVWRFWDWHHRDLNKSSSLVYQYCFPWYLLDKYDAKLKAIKDPEDRRVLEYLRTFERERLSNFQWVGLTGGGYTHGTLNYEQVIREGFLGYRNRLQKLLKTNPRENQRVFWESLLIVVQAAEVIQRRLIRQIEISPVGKDQVDKKIKLISALERVPMAPASNFYEAMLAATFVFYFDGCDSPGRMDQYLIDTYRHDRQAGLIDDDFVLGLLSEFWDNMGNNWAWNVAIGGTTGPAGKNVVNELTYLCLESSKGRRSPNLALRIPGDADDRLWDATLDTLAAGNGLPALYNNDLYVQALKDYGLISDRRDAHEVCFGGCTETMVQGRSNVGSLAGNLHMLMVLDRTVHRYLNRTKTFDEFYAIYLKELADEIDTVCGEVNSNSEIKGRLYPQMIRSLLVDDCIENAKDYYGGGARYNWEIIGVEGFSNVVDSLFALKKLVFEEGYITGKKMQKVLQENFNGYEFVLNRIRILPRYGQGNKEVDALASDLGNATFGEFKKQTAWRGGGKFLASCLMFETYAHRGSIVGASPDGRRAGEPLGDSMGAYQGRDKFGPTALLNSVTSYRHKDAPGTLVVNIRFSRDMLLEKASRQKVRALVETYFARGGMQIQLNVVDQKVLLDAMEHPENHEDLIIRIGGYSQFFNDLSKELKLSILERTIHGG